MIAKNRIWEEMMQAKANTICLQKYTDRRRKYSRYYNMFIILASSVGALSFQINIIIPVITSSLVGVVAIVKASMPNFIQTEQELSELDRLMDFYSKYLNTLEEIWYNFFYEYKDEKETMESFFKTKNIECDKYSILNKGIRSISVKEQEEIDREAADYINRVYFTKSIEDETKQQ